MWFNNSASLIISLPNLSMSCVTPAGGCVRGRFAEGEVGISDAGVGIAGIRSHDLTDEVSDRRDSVDHRSMIQVRPDDPSNEWVLVAGKRKKRSRQLISFRESQVY